jgi:hypothetical protein
VFVEDGLFLVGSASIAMHGEFKVGVAVLNGHQEVLHLHLQGQLLADFAEHSAVMAFAVFDFAPGEFKLSGNIGVAPVPPLHGQNLILQPDDRRNDLDLFHILI